jgi:SnoaL-like domain
MGPTVTPTGAQSAAVAAWHTVVDSRDPARLADLLAEDVVFYSPAVFSPQEGRQLTTAYLSAAMVVLGPSLRYVEEWYGDHSAVLEFEAELEGTFVQGIDMMRWNAADRLVEFTVMVRPFRGIEKLIELMSRQLSQQR